jgi:hypothetical protein
VVSIIIEFITPFVMDRQKGKTIGSIAIAEPQIPER